MARKIVIPFDISIMDPMTGNPLPIIDPITNKPCGVQKIEFKNFVIGMILADAKWGKTWKDLSTAYDIRQIVTVADGSFELSDTEWDEVCDILKTPTNGYNPGFAVQCINFFRAILNAEEIK